MIRRAVVAATLLAVVAGSTAAWSSSEPTPGASGIGDAYFPTDGNGGYDVRHYGVHDTWDDGLLTGWTTITARATQDLSRFNLDLLLDVRKVLVDGVPVRRFAKPTRHELVVEPATAVQRGETFRVRVAYRGRPARISWRDGGLFHHDGEVVAMNEPHMAPWWFPANDHPSDKAAFDIHVTAPSTRQVISNGTLVRRTDRADRRTWHWRMRTPMTTYLAFFAIGRFRVERGRYDGLPWTIAVSRQLGPAQQEQALRLMRTTPRVVAWLETQLGEYPFGSTGGVTTGIPGVWFALENQSRPTYPFVGGRGRIDLVVHEQAHQWFGDDVAVRRWRDIWLNEGFATFMELRYAETHGGEPAQDWLRSEWQFRGSDPGFWRVPIGDPGPGRLFDHAVYERGAMTVQALRHRLGEADFWELIRTWLDRHRRGNGSVAQFRALAEHVSGEQLDGFFHAWLVATVRPAWTADNGLV